MWMLCKKEWHQFFSSATSYIILCIFLLITGLLLFVFPDTSLLNFGYANLNGFFNTMPWILLFLVPAITMKTIAEETRSGTFEVLKCLPLSSLQIIIGKYMGVLFIVFISIFPTIIYAVSMQALSITGGIDTGSTIGSYFSLFMLASVYAAIGIFASSITKNTITAFATGAFLCFILFIGFDAMSQLPIFVGGVDYYISLFGIKSHTTNMARGMIDTKDLIYFVSLIAFFLYLTHIQIKQPQPQL